MSYAMTLDNSWTIMDEEEMQDVNGGYKAKTGISALAAISVMIADTLDWGKASVALISTAVAASVTGVGALLLIGAAMLGSFTISLGVLTGLTACIALGLYMADGGFQHKSLSFWRYSLHLIKPLS